MILIPGVYLGIRVLLGYLGISRVFLGYYSGIARVLLGYCLGIARVLISYFSITDYVVNI